VFFLLLFDRSISKNEQKIARQLSSEFLFTNQLQTLEVSWQFAVGGFFLVGEKKVVGEFFWRSDSVHP
jgi:hypothetical protein